MRDQQHHDPTPAEFDLIAEACLHGDHDPPPPSHDITGPSCDARTVRFSLFGCRGSAALRVLATVLISILIMLAGTLAAGTLV
ncbi:MAG: hypothetical protein O3C40_33655 [Planctomycetota bacterium]|nr:hypothetical protein [Planctomycetota bacterium]